MTREDYLTIATASLLPGFRAQVHGVAAYYAHAGFAPMRPPPRWLTVLLPFPPIGSWIGFEPFATEVAPTLDTLTIDIPVFAGAPLDELASPKRLRPILRMILRHGLDAQDRWPDSLDSWNREHFPEWLDEERRLIEEERERLEAEQRRRFRDTLRRWIDELLPTSALTDIIRRAPRSWEVEWFDVPEEAEGRRREYRERIEAATEAQRAATEGPYRIVRGRRTGQTVQGGYPLAPVRPTEEQIRRWQTLRDQMVARPRRATSSEQLRFDPLRERRAIEELAPEHRPARSPLGADEVAGSTLEADTQGHDLEEPEIVTKSRAAVLPWDEWVKKSGELLAENDRMRSRHREEED